MSTISAARIAVSIGRGRPDAPYTMDLVHACQEAWRPCTGPASPSPQGNLQVIQFIPEGLTAQDIGKKLYVTTYTVCTHIFPLMEGPTPGSDTARGYCSA